MWVHALRYRRPAHDLTNPSDRRAIRRQGRYFARVWAAVLATYMHRREAFSWNATVGVDRSSPPNVAPLRELPRELFILVSWPRTRRPRWESTRKSRR